MVPLMHLACIPLLNRLWLKEPRRPLNLLAPDIVCEAHIHVLGNGDSKMYASKLPPDMTAEEKVYIVKVLLDQVIAFGNQQGVQVNVNRQ